MLDGIGSTEMFQTFLSNRPGDVRFGTTGKAVPGYELKIVDEHGSEVADDEIGELIVRGPTAGEGYWNQRAKSRHTFAGEWTHTGDKFFRDADGYYHYCGRTDDMFKVSGMWVSPFEVETALASHEAVLEAAVIGKEDSDGLIKPKAFIVLRNGYAADERLIETLRVHVKACAGPWKYPRWIDIRPICRAPQPASFSASNCWNWNAPIETECTRRSSSRETACTYRFAQNKFLQSDAGPARRRPGGDNGRA